MRNGRNDEQRTTRGEKPERAHHRTIAIGMEEHASVIHASYDESPCTPATLRSGGWTSCFVAKG
jgi:hypothetical protein